MKLFDQLGASLARYLASARHVHSASSPADLESLRRCLQPADVILVEGHSKISTGIKYLTQSTWSHAALYVGSALSDRHQGKPEVSEPSVVEADVVEGVRAVSLLEFAGLHVRICRAISLTPAERQAVVSFAVSRIGYRYDLKNIVDLLRWLLPTPPVPARFRRRMIHFGSGDPTQAICSTLVAQAFQSVRYPILPLIELRSSGDPACPDCVEEVLYIRHHSRFVPKDFDVSPYFEIIKPTLAQGFDHHRLQWSTTELPPASTDGAK